MFFLPAFLLAGMAAVFVVWLGTFIWQIFLSKADNPWLGLILPGITFGLILYISTMAPDSYTVWYVLISLFAGERKKGKAGVAYAYLGHAGWAVGF